jgi:hypothetical protein
LLPGKSSRALLSASPGGGALQIGKEIAPRAAFPPDGF